MYELGLTQKVSRQGAWVTNLPTVTGPLKARDHFLPRDYRTELFSVRHRD
jgi:hypothetical protein